MVSLYHSDWTRKVQSTLYSSNQLLHLIALSDLNLFHVADFNGGDDLTVHVRTTIRYDYSFIESAAIRIGNDTLSVSGWRVYSFNGVDGALANYWAKSIKGAFL